MDRTEQQSAKRLWRDTPRETEVAMGFWRQLRKLPPWIIILTLVGFAAGLLGIWAALSGRR